MIYLPPTSSSLRVTRSRPSVRLLCLLCFLQSLIPFADVWVDGNGGLRSKTTVRLVPLRALQSFNIFVSRPLARR